MKTSKYLLMLPLVGFIGLGTTGCGDGYKSGGTAESLSVISEVEMNELNVDMDEFEKSLAEAKEEAELLTIAALLGSSGSSSNFSKAEIESSSLDKKIAKVFDRLVGALEKLQDRADSLRERLEAYRRLIDPENTINIPVLDRLDQQIEQLRNLQARISGQIDDFIGMVDDRLADVDRKVMEMDPRNPLSWAAAILWQKVRTSVVEQRDRLVERIRG